jgi:hypothetical protein
VGARLPWVGRASGWGFSVLAGSAVAAAILLWQQWPHPVRDGAAGHAASTSSASEAAQLLKARRALARGQTELAGRELDRYQRAFPNGTLVEEAKRLRIELEGHSPTPAVSGRLPAPSNLSDPKGARRR